MAKLLEIVEGWGKDLGPFTLLADGVAVELPPDVELILKDATGVAINTSAAVRVADNQSTTGKGQVYFTPVPGEMTNAKSPYTVHWKVTDATDEPVFFPNGAADSIVVYKP